MFGVGEIAHGLDLAKAGTEGVTAGSMMGRTALHAGAGCLSSMVGGGTCKAGAISGALGELGTHMPGSDNYVFGAAKGAMMGGVGAKLAGGKFADGAQTGAFGYMFNHAMEHGAFGPLRDFFNKGMENLNNVIPKAVANVSTGVEVTGMIGFAGGSYSASQAVDMNGNICFVQQGCAIVGAGLGVTVTNTYQLSSGSLSNGAENGVGLAAFAGLGAAGKLAPFQLNFDGNVSGQAGFGKGAGAGGGIKICRQITKC